MQGLEPVCIGAGGARIQTAKFKLRSQDLLDAGEQFRLGNHRSKQLIVIYQIGQAIGSRFLFKFSTRPNSQLSEQFCDPTTDSAHQGGISEIFQDKKSFLIEQASLFVIKCNRLVHRSLPVRGVDHSFVNSATPPLSLASELIS